MDLSSYFLAECFVAPMPVVCGVLGGVVDSVLWWRCPGVRLGWRRLGRRSRLDHWPRNLHGGGGHLRCQNVLHESDWNPHLRSRLILQNRLRYRVHYWIRYRGLQNHGAKRQVRLKKKFLEDSEKSIFWDPKS